MKDKSAFLKLCIMMFMQYFIFAVWWVPFPAYITNTLNLGSSEVALILCAMAIGSMGSSFIGLIADRHFSSEKVLAALNLLTAGFLLIASQQTSFIGLLITITLVMLCYMPTWSLTSAIAMTHISAEQFPRMRMLGTVGWFASGIFSVVAIKGMDVINFEYTSLPMYCAIAVGVIAAVLNLTLPKTPPNKEKAKTKISVIDVFGLRTLSVLKNKNYNVFILVSFLAIIPFCLYHLYGSVFLADEGVGNITVTMNWAQAAEIFFLLITTTILIKCGFKKTLIFGLVFMLIRYVAFFAGFEFGYQWMYTIGILVHGLIFGLFFVAGQVYTDKVVPHELRAQAQGFLAFIIWGVGYLIGTLFNGHLIGEYRLEEKADWSVLFAVSSIITVVLIIVMALLFKQTDHQTEEKAKQ